jgi:hypothetical protein
VELTWGLILASLRHLPFEDRLKQGHWHTTVGTRVRRSIDGIKERQLAENVSLPWLLHHGALVGNDLSMTEPSFVRI